MILWVFIVLFAVLGIVSILAPKVTRFLYFWGTIWYAKKSSAWAAFASSASRIWALRLFYGW